MATNKKTSAKWYQKLTPNRPLIALLVVAIFSIAGGIYLRGSHAASGYITVKYADFHVMTPGANRGNVLPYTVKETIDTYYVNAGSTVYHLPASYRSYSTAQCNAPIYSPSNQVGPCPTNNTYRIDTGTFIAGRCYILKIIGTTNGGIVFIWDSTGGCQVLPFVGQTWVSTKFHVNPPVPSLYRICAEVRRDQTAPNEGLQVSMGKTIVNYSLAGSTGYSDQCTGWQTYNPSLNGMDIIAKVINVNAKHAMRVAYIKLQRQVTLPINNSTNNLY
ncbi:MAG TPA: hypothetical protein VLF39_00610 [Candidatus Saccharimonadales bacterium]|nr:hypothetical protein [Candidatus Saccharimonadales bacterium]